MQEGNTTPETVEIPTFSAFTMPSTTQSKRRRIEPVVPVATTTPNSKSTSSASTPANQQPSDDNLSPHLTVLTVPDDSAKIINDYQSVHPTVPDETVITIDDDVAAPPAVITVEDLAADEIATPDVDLAFELQMAEAIAASASAAASSARALFSDEFAAAPDVFADEIARLDREQANPQPFVAEMWRTRDDFDLQLHDRKVAEEIIAIPDDEWQVTSDDYHRPYTIGSTSSIGGSDLAFFETFSLYFKGLVVEDKNKVKLGAIGVAILNSRNVVVFEVSKALILPEAEMRDEVAELEAFVLGLEFAFSLELRSLVYFCVDFDVDHFLNATEKPKDAKVAELVHGADLLKNSFLQCHSSGATETNAELVLQLARSSIEKQSGKPFEEVILIKETCPICLEDIDSAQMFEIGNCRHSFCYSCLQKHVEIKVRERELPRCPELNCGLELDINGCRNFLSKQLYDVIDQLVKESSIPIEEKVYCPNPKCSNLMSKTDDAIANDKSVVGPRTCEKCYTQLCVNCKKLWHPNLSCDAYKKWKLDLDCADAKLERLAGDEKWRQCPRCSHMVELVLGCYHIYCRCGHQFCYLCGSERKDKRATCTCPSWSEDKIIIDGAANVQ